MATTNIASESITNIQWSNNKSSSTVPTALERIGAHSHISGLGLDERLQVLPTQSNLIGQVAARRAMGIVLKLAKSGHWGGRAVLLAGPPSTGKTALANALAKDLSTSNTVTIGSSNKTKPQERPFYSICASQIYAHDVNATEKLTQALRQSMGVQIVEEVEVLEGEVVEIQMDTVLATSTDASSGPSSQIKKAGRITMCTTEMETVYDLGGKMLESIKQERVSAGDVIRIDKGSGKITKLGRSYSRSRDYDAISSSTKFVQTPEGELLKRQEIAHMVSLHEIDVINSRQQGFLALLAGDTGEIRPELREQVNAKIAEWREEGRATLVPGVLFLDEVHLLDLESFAYLNRALESPLAPLVVMATNRGMETIQGTSYMSPHGIPLDLLDRLMIIPTQEYSHDELKQILQVRCREEEVETEEDALELLARIASETSLRYAMQLITMSHLSAKQDNKRKIVKIGDVERCFRLFVDVKRSTKLLLDYQHEFMFNEAVPSDQKAPTDDKVLAKIDAETDDKDAGQAMETDPTLSPQQNAMSTE